MERAVVLDKAVKAFGGYSGLARRLKVPLSTCHGWARRNKLPQWRADKIASIARAEHKDVFGDMPKRKRQGPRRKRLN